MLKYLVILLDDISVSFCHYENRNTVHRLIALEDLKAGIFFAMKENLMIQFVYPNYELPQIYKDVIQSIDHSKIVPVGYIERGDVVVVNDWEVLKGCFIDKNTAYVLRSEKKKLFENHELLKNVLGKVERLNIVITDVETFTEKDFEDYKHFLHGMMSHVKQMYVHGKSPQINLLTDRMMLDQMNNCNAGWENVTLAPDGKFYVCPAFYLVGGKGDIGLNNLKCCIGDLQNGLNIKNPQLYKLSHAPLCRQCDAYQCRRCIWLNREMTFEVNTPSHEQCVVAHLERNASRELLYSVRKYGDFLPGIEIDEISYTDPFENVINM